MSTNQQSNSVPTWVGWLKIAAGIFGIFVQSLDTQTTGVPGSAVTTNAHAAMVLDGAHTVANTKG